MASYKLSIKPSAGKDLEAVGSKADRTRVVAKIAALATNPRPHGSEKVPLAEQPDLANRSDSGAASMSHIGHGHQP